MTLRKLSFKYYLLLSLIMIIILFTYITTFASFPNELTIFEGEEYICNIINPILISIKADKEGIVNLISSDKKASKSFINLSTPISVKSEKKGNVNLDLKLFGLIPFKTMKIQIIENKEVIPCGNTIGVKLKVNGILIIGMSDVRVEDGKKVIPTKDLGIKAGDLIIEVNNKEVTSIDDLIKVVENSNGNSISCKYKRDDFVKEVIIKPVKSQEDNKYRIGLWVRDSTAGIGTLTFYDPETESFGALGHGITDIDTGEIMPVEKGQILVSNVKGIRKGIQGKPGELKGTFLEENKVIGDITLNCLGGIYGKINNSTKELLPNKMYPIASKAQVEEGHAKILSNINGYEIGEYDIEIQKVSKQSINGSKGMIIKITDKKLLNQTGGIVQGMSGSPIIQNGKLIGAVTHVLVNDPTRGYGIFIEWMLANMSENNKILNKAG